MGFVWKLLLLLLHIFFSRMLRKGLSRTTLDVISNFFSRFSCAICPRDCYGIFLEFPSRIAQKIILEFCHSSSDSSVNSSLIFSSSSDFSRRTFCIYISSTFLYYSKSYFENLGMINRKNRQRMSWRNHSRNTAKSPKPSS